MESPSASAVPTTFGAAPTVVPTVAPVAAPSPTCCGSDPICFPPRSLSASGASTAHDLGRQGTNFDGAFRPGDASWLALPADGSGFMSTVNFGFSEFNIPCSTRAAFIATHYLAIDDATREDAFDSVLTLDNRLFSGVGSVDFHASYQVPRSAFVERFKPQAFPMLVRNLECNADRWSLRIFNGVSYPAASATPAPASIIHYFTGFERWAPQFWTASHLTLGGAASLGVGGVTASSPASAQDYLIAGGPGVQLPYGEIQVEFVLELGAEPVRSSSDPVALIDVYSERDGTTLVQLQLVAGDFSATGVPTTFTLVAQNSAWASSLVSFRVYKNAGVLLTFHTIGVCGSTDGAPCSTQVADSCTTTNAPTSAPGETPCVYTGECCTYNPCCPESGSTCTMIGPFEVCLLDEYSPIDATAAPTPAPTHGPVTAYISTSWATDLDFWTRNADELNAGYTLAVSDLILPLFPDAVFGNVIVSAGSVIAALPWLNVPYSALQNPALISGLLPSGCFTNIPQEYLLSQLAATHCTVSFLRLCSDGSLVAWIGGECPTPSPTAAPVAPSLPTPAPTTQAPTLPPSVVNQGAQNDLASKAAEIAARNFNLIIGLLAGVFFCCLLLCCLRQFHRQRQVNKAMKELQEGTLPTESFADQSFASSTMTIGGSEELEMSVSPTMGDRLVSPGSSASGSASPSYSRNYSPSRSPPPGSVTYMPPGMGGSVGMGSPEIGEGEDSFSNWDDHFHLSSGSVTPQRAASPLAQSAVYGPGSSGADLTVSGMERVWQANAPVTVNVANSMPPSPANKMDMTSSVSSQPGAPKTSWDFV